MIDIDICEDHWKDGVKIPEEDPAVTAFGHVSILNEGWKTRAQMCVHKLIRIIRPGGLLKPTRGTVESLVIKGIGKELADNVGRKVLHSIPEWYHLSLKVPAFHLHSTVLIVFVLLP